MNKMDLYNSLRKVPEEAKKEIAAGRLKGFTDINPMWRIKALTEAFGPCGIGWWYEITDKRLEAYKDEIKAFVDIKLYYKTDMLNVAVSQPVVGTGGASFVTMEKNGPYVSDECFKMALTDAISVAAKSLGVGADVYYNKDRDKYTADAETGEAKADGAAEKSKEGKEAKSYTCSGCGAAVTNKVAKYSWDKYGKILCMDCQKKV